MSSLTLRTITAMALFAVAGVVSAQSPVVALHATLLLTSTTKSTAPKVVSLPVSLVVSPTPTALKVVRDEQGKSHATCATAPRVSP